MRRQRLQPHHTKTARSRSLLRRRDGKCLRTTLFAHAAVADGISKHGYFHLLACADARKSDIGESAAQLPALEKDRPLFSRRRTNRLSHWTPFNLSSRSIPSRR